MVIRSLTEAKSNRMPKGSPNLSYSLYQKKLSYSRCANIQVSDRVGSVRGALFLRRSFFLSVPLYQCAWFERMTPGHQGGVGRRFLMVKDDSSDSIKWDRCIKKSLWKFYFIINEIFVLSRNLEVAFQKTLRGAKNWVNSMAEGVDRFHMFKAILLWRGTTEAHRKKERRTDFKLGPL